MGSEPRQQAPGGWAGARRTCRFGTGFCRSARAGCARDQTQNEKTRTYPRAMLLLQGYR
jgi:hypothetical protein